MIFLVSKRKSMTPLERVRDNTAHVLAMRHVLATAQAVAGSSSYTDDSSSYHLQRWVFWPQ